MKISRYSGCIDTLLVCILVVLVLRSSQHTVKPKIKQKLEFKKYENFYLQIREKKNFNVFAKRI